MKNSQRDFFNEVIRPKLIQMTIDCSLPSDMNELSAEHFEDEAAEYNLKRPETDLSIIVCWTKTIRNVSQHPDKSKNHERLIELGHRSEFKQVADYQVFESEDEAEAKYIGLRLRDDLHSASICYVKASTDYATHPSLK